VPYWHIDTGMAALLILQTAVDEGLGACFFGIPPDRRSYVLLKARDLLAAIIFGAALIIGALLTWVSSWLLTWILSLVGVDSTTVIVDSSIRIGSVIVSFVLNSTALAALFRFLTGTSLRWRDIWPGAALGGAALTVLQFGAGLLLSYPPSNPLLATFAIFVGQDPEPVA